MKRLLFHVSDADIEQGVSNSETQCPIALAIAYTLPNARHVRVTNTTISWSDVVQRVRHFHNLPSNLAPFIDNCDKGKSVAPIDFVLNGNSHIQTKPMSSGRRRLDKKGIAKLRPKRKYVRKVPARKTHSRSGNPWAGDGG